MILGWKSLSKLEYNGQQEEDQHKDYLTEQTCSSVSTIARRYLNSKVLCFMGWMSAFPWPVLFV